MKTRDERIENFKKTMVVGIANGMYDEAEAEELVKSFIKQLDETEARRVEKIMSQFKDLD